MGQALHGQVLRLEKELDNLVEQTKRTDGKGENEQVGDIGAPQLTRTCATRHEKGVFRLIQGRYVGRRFDPLQRRATEQQSLLAPVLIPQGRLALEDAEVGLEPGGVVLAHGRNQAVVGQLVPRRAPALFGPEQVRVHHKGDGRVRQPAGGCGRPQHLAAQARLGDKLRLHPRPDLALAHAAGGGGRRDLLGVIAAERRVHIARMINVGHRDRVARLTRPQPVADHLKLHRIDALAQYRLAAAIGALHAGLAQIVGQPGRRIVGESAARRTGWPLHGLAGLRWVKQIEPVGRRQARWDGLEQRLERAQIILAQQKQRPAARIFQQRAQLAEEGRLRRPVVRVGAQHLLELVEDKNLLGLSRRLAGQIVGQAERCQRLYGQMLGGRTALVETEQRGDAEAIGAAHRQLGAHTDDRAYQKALVAQARDERGAHQRAFACPRRRVQQHEATGQQQVKQLLQLALAPKEACALALLEGARADVWIGWCRVAHAPPCC